MAFNEKIRTEDVVELLDGKVLTTQSHAVLGVTPRENYDSVLTKLTALVPSPDQKDALDATLTAPSGSNPVVLKDDLAVYVPAADLGDIRDAVPTFADLPVPFGRTGDLQNDSAIVLNISSGSGLLAAGQSIAGIGINANTLVVDVLSGSSLQMSQNATQSASAVSLLFAPVVGEMRPVLADGIIYRWTGVAWDPFIRTGTMDHTQLQHQNDDPLYQHVTLADKNDLIANSHQHANQVILDNIISAGSGEIITNEERARLPSQDQKNALLGTSGTPSAFNPYVTTTDSRLATVRNPYVTVGPPGSLASFTGVDFRPFEDAIAAISSGSATAVKAIEVLPAFFTLGGVALRWDSQTASLLFEAFAPGTVTLSFQSFAAGLQLLDTTGLKGSVTVRGFVFELNGEATAGILTSRVNTLIENCTFKPGPVTAVEQTGVTLNAENCIVRNCRFVGQLTTGVLVAAARCKVEGCSFALSNSSHAAVRLAPAATGTIVTGCTLEGGRVWIEAGALDNQIVLNHFGVSASILDQGSSTRILENQPQDLNQPFTGRRRTVGPVGTYADYRGSDQTPFEAALADPFVTEIDVLQNVYQFTAPITVPTGKALRGVTQGSGEVEIRSILSNSEIIVLESDTTLENLVLNAASTVVATQDSTNVLLRRCTLKSTSGWAINATATQDFQLDGCHVEAQQGCRLDGLHARVMDCSFETTDLDLSLVGNEADIEHNIFGNAPYLGGARHIIDGNMFMGEVPTKTHTTDSVWVGNYPAPAANNPEGVDFVTIPLETALQPLVGVQHGTLSDNLTEVGSLVFRDSVTDSATTLPVRLPARLDRAQGFNVALNWAAAQAGDAVWSTTVVFWDEVGNALGDAVQNTLTSSRLTANIRQSTDVVFEFTNLQYGLPSDVMPSHIGIKVERFGHDPLDTLPAAAHLLGANVTLARD